MQDHEKFEAFKKETVQQQEAMYGAEVRQAYGDSEAEASQKKFLQMTPAQYERFQQLEQEILTGLEQAVQNGETAEGAVAQHLVWLHKEWLSMTWSQYTPPGPIRVWLRCMLRMNGFSNIMTSMYQDVPCFWRRQCATGREPVRLEQVTATIGTCAAITAGDCLSLAGLFV